MAALDILKLKAVELQERIAALKSHILNGGLMNAGEVTAVNEFVDAIEAASTDIADQLFPMTHVADTSAPVVAVMA